MSFGSWLKGQFAELNSDILEDLRKTAQYVQKKRRFARRTHVAGFGFKTIKVVRVKRTVWEFHHHPQGQGQPILVERIRGHQSEVLEWARQQDEAYIFLWRLQMALDKGKLTPKEYYRVLDRWGGCKRPHIHSQHCKYHAKH